MQTNPIIDPIIHPKRNRRPVRSWKHRANKYGNRTKKVSQYRIVSMA